MFTVCREQLLVALSYSLAYGVSFTVFIFSSLVYGESLTVVSSYSLFTVSLTVVLFYSLAYGVSLFYLIHMFAVYS